MSHYILKKENLKQALQKLISSGFYGPVEDRGTILYKKIDDIEKLHLNTDRISDSPVKFAFPQVETILKFEEGNSNPVQPKLDENDYIIWGVNPCDAKAFTVLDKVFGGDFTDSYYNNRRQHLTLIGLACTSPKKECFCLSVGGNPFGKENLDVFMTDLGSSYFIEDLTQKGSHVVEQIKDFLTAPSQNDIDQKNKFEVEAKKQQKKINIEAISNNLEKLFFSPIWNEEALECIGCGVCSYMCPTCHCFDIQDEVLTGKGRRVRVWDSCQFAEYTKEASGENPRPARSWRVKNRVFHKYLYSKKSIGMIGCVGCGRCITFCPSGRDVTETLQKIEDSDVK